MNVKKHNGSCCCGVKQKNASVNIVVVSEQSCWVPCIPSTARGRCRSLAEYGRCLLWVYSVHIESMTSQDVSNTTAVTSQMLCKPKSDVFDKMNGVFIVSASYVIPQALIFGRYYLLVTFIARQGHQTTGGLTSSFVSHNRTRIIKMLVIIAVLFSFAWLPYFVLLVGAVSFCLLIIVFLFYSIYCLSIINNVVFV